MSVLLRSVHRDELLRSRALAVHDLTNVALPLFRYTELLKALEPAVDLLLQVKGGGTGE